jgi:hypothetical protein
VKPMNGSTRLIKDGKQQTSQVVSFGSVARYCLVVVICHFSKKRMIERESQRNQRSWSWLTYRYFGI